MMLDARVVVYYYYCYYYFFFLSDVLDDVYKHYGL